ncbi:MAG: guanylate kinase [bacterium]|nr:guanylate kinase [bacterium]
MEKSLLIIVSAPSGTGKTTICKKLLQTTPNLIFSVSMTTRQPRDNEINGRDYYFISHEEFKERIKKGDFIEWAQVYDDYYGTPKKALEDSVLAGMDMLLDVDGQGAMNIKKEFKDRAVLIFIAPPFLEDLKTRLSNRMTDTSEEIEKRFLLAKEELRNISKYDYCVVNDDVGVTVGKLKSIITAEKNKVKRIGKGLLKKLEVEDA